MLKILYGRTNKGKLQAMRTALESFDLEIVGLNDMEGELPIIEENGTTSLENAQIKAKAYYERFKMPVFSCDSGLYFDEQHCYSSMDESIFTEKFIMTAIPHPKRVEGFPMDSLSIDIPTGKYYYDLDVKDVSTSVDDGVRKFFKEIFAG